MLLLNQLPSLQVLMALIKENWCKEYNSEVNLHDPHLSCLGHSQACWRDFTFRLAGFNEGSTLMKANFRLVLTPNHPEEQTDGLPPYLYLLIGARGYGQSAPARNSSPPPPTFQIQYQATVTQKATAHAFFNPISFVRRHLFGWKMAYCWMPISQPKVFNVDCHMLS